MHCAGTLYTCQLLLELVKEQALINEQLFFLINLINGPCPLPPFSLAVAGLSSPLIGTL